ncbi:single-strand DNA-binding protein [Clostridium amylolyticum]|uniref:Single-stranded DNA-binding protein n=1 Tax=Clostridium amylolyticum TaxID=1121298 RepID=A0A1M6L167_9CLOT|nr:single-stranded DNA-binding protein [Clostridium amylolyticum]SHJ64980.1 single-strand DNA-binding protein [Clostridium amylolyticum]
MNRVVLIGRLTKDPDLKYIAESGTPVSNFVLAVNRQKRKDQEKPEADFITCVAFGKTAETIAQYLTKGRQLAISGSIRTGSYEAQDGSKRYTTSVYIDSFDFIDSGSGQINRKNNSNNFAGTPYDNEYGDMQQANDDEDIPF